MDLINQGRSPRPPTHYLCGHIPTDWAPGRSAFAMPPSPWFSIAGGFVSPGVVALPADAALGTALATTLPPGVVITTSELTINYLRPVGMRRLAARASVIDSSPFQGLIESSVVDDDGRMVAHLTSRYVTLKVPIPLDQLPDGEIPLADDPGYESGVPYLQPLPAKENLPPDDTRPGLEAFAAVARGERPRPPIARLLGIMNEKVSEGTAVMSIPAHRWFTSPATTIYGGITALALEIVSTAAVSTTLPAGWSCAPLDTKIQFLRPWLPDGARCELRAEVIHRGRRLAITRAELTNGSDKIVAIATGSTLILERPWSEFGTMDALPAGDGD